MTFTIGDTTYGILGPFYATLAGIASGVIIGFVSEYFTSAKYSPGQEARGELADGPGDHGHDRDRGRHGEHGGAGAGARRLHHRRAPLRGDVRHRHGRVRHAGNDRHGRGGRFVRTGRGQRRRHRGDGGSRPEVREITDNLDAVGNTTAAIGKGFAIGSAAFAAIGLLSAYMVSAGITVADMSDPKVMAGLLVGGMLPFLFSSMLFGAVSKVAFKMIDEVRRQFREIPGLLKGEGDARLGHVRRHQHEGRHRGHDQARAHGDRRPGRSSASTTRRRWPGLLVGAVVTGVVLGIQTANSGGAMDNAKKYIEEGHFGGKGSDAHKAAVVGDTVGDPLKDTVGPSINILIKLMSVISLVLAPLFIGG